jgi:exoribonuclease R
MTPEDNRPATKQDLDRTVESIAAAIQAAEDRAQKFARGIETNLLTAFHGHAKGQTARLHTAEVTTHDMGIRIAALEERVLNIETRQRPPQ